VFNKNTALGAEFILARGLTRGERGGKGKEPLIPFMRGFIYDAGRGGVRGGEEGGGRKGGGGRGGEEGGGGRGMREGGGRRMREGRGVREGGRGHARGTGEMNGGNEA